MIVLDIIQIMNVTRQLVKTCAKILKNVKGFQKPNNENEEWVSGIIMVFGRNKKKRYSYEKTSPATIVYPDRTEISSSTLSGTIEAKNLNDALKVVRKRLGNRDGYRVLIEES